MGSVLPVGQGEFQSPVAEIQAEYSHLRHRLGGSIPAVLQILLANCFAAPEYKPGAGRFFLKRGEECQKLLQGQAQR